MSDGWYTLAQGTDDGGASYELLAEKTEDGLYKVIRRDEYGNDYESGIIVTDSTKYDAGFYFNDWYAYEFSFYCGAVFESKTPKPIDEKYMPVLTSPNGTKYKISVADDGTIKATAV